MEPVRWVNDLKEVLDSVKTRLDGRPVSIETAFESLEKILAAARDGGKTVWWAGNGGSAAICIHLSQDLVNKLRIRSCFLGDPALMSCMANDYGYENVYSHPLGVQSSAGDTLIAISSSGNSENILSCAGLAQEKELRLITLSGFDEHNALWNLPAEVSFFASSDLYGQVEICHEAILHAAFECYWLNHMC